MNINICVGISRLYLNPHMCVFNDVGESLCVQWRIQDFGRGWWESIFIGYGRGRALFQFRIQESSLPTSMLNCIKVGALKYVQFLLQFIKRREYVHHTKPFQFEKGLNNY